MDETTEVTCEQEFEEMEADYESANFVKWLWVAAGGLVAGGIATGVWFVKSKLLGKKDDDDEIIETDLVDEETVSEDVEDSD